MINFFRKDIPIHLPVVVLLKSFLLSFLFPCLYIILFDPRSSLLSVSAISFSYFFFLFLGLIVPLRFKVLESLYHSFIPFLSSRFSRKRFYWIVFITIISLLFLFFLPTHESYESKSLQVRSSYGLLRLFISYNVPFMLALISGTS